MKSEMCRVNLMSGKVWKLLLLLFTFHFSFLMTSCDGGDDDGRRLAEHIVGTWQRGWNEGDIIIEGDTTFSISMVMVTITVWSAMALSWRMIPWER